MSHVSRLFLPGVVAGLLLTIPVGAQSADPAHPFTGTPITVGQSANAPGSSNATLPDGIESIAPASAQTENPPGSDPAEQTYIVRPGDYLARIAKALLGDPALYTEIVRLNADKYPSLLKNPNLIYAGWKLRIPGRGPRVATTGRPTVDPTLPATPTPSPAGPQSGDAPTNVTPTPTTTEPGQPTGGAPLIGPSTRVLHIGDSHTVGTYGSTVDDLMRATGAKVDTVGVAGSSPSWYLKGTTTHCGYFSRDEKGKVVRPADWRAPMPTPDFRQLIRDFKPNVIVMSLGANLIGASESRINSEVKSLCEIARANGCQVVWVGPPNGRADKKPDAVQNRLCDALAKAVAPYGTFVDSRPYTRYPATGGDGVHFGGTEGTKIAKNWANAVFDQTQKIPAKK